MTFPTPTGAAPIIQDFTTPNPSLSYSQAIAQLLAQMRAQGDTALANQFNTFQQSYHKAHPSAGAMEVLQAYLNSKLGNAVGSTVGQTVTVLGKIPQAAATGAQDAYQSLVGGLGAGSAAPAGTGSAIIYMLFEFVAVGIMGIIAGINKEAGKAMVFLMVGFWIIALIVGSAGAVGISNFVAAITGNAPYSPQAFNNYSK